MRGVLVDVGRCPRRCCRPSCGRRWSASHAEIERDEKTKMSGKDPFGGPLLVARARALRIQGDIDKLLELHLQGLDRAIWKKRNDALNVEKGLAVAEVGRIERAKRENEARTRSLQSVEARVGAILDELARATPTLERKRQVLRDLVQTEKLVVDWGRRTLTLPSFGSLGAVAHSFDQDFWTPAEGTTLVTRTAGQDPLQVEADAVDSVLRMGGHLLSRTGEAGRVKLLSGSRRSSRATCRERLRAPPRPERHVRAAEADLDGRNLPGSAARRDAGTRPRSRLARTPAAPGKLLIDDRLSDRLRLVQRPLGDALLTLFAMLKERRASSSPAWRTFPQSCSTR